MTSSPNPFRQIRAQYDDDSITVYQAYSDNIGKAAVAAQKLDASPEFRFDRMTWIKPSWCWMMYRSGYASKDNRQTCILAIKMKHEGFLKLLEGARVSHCDDKNQGAMTIVQWDPERSPKIGKLSYRSIQIGILAKGVETWINEWIVEIEDVTERARKLRANLDEDGDVAADTLREMGLLPQERVYEVPEHIRKGLHMDET